MPLRPHDLHPSPGAKRSRKRVGRGNAAGGGTYAGRGLKGQKSRSGGGTRPGFEGGQMSMIRKMPRKRGFTPRFRVEYTAVNLAQLNDRFEAESDVNPETLVQAGLLRSVREPYKVLAEGEIDRPLTIWTVKVSAAARRKIEAAGGRLETLPSS